MNVVTHAVNGAAPQPKLQSICANARPSQTEPGPSDRAANHEKVRRWIGDLIAETAVSEQQLALLDAAMSGLAQDMRAAALSGDCIASIDLPLAVHAALTGTVDGAIPLAATCALVCLGVKLLTDDDPRAREHGYCGDDMSVAASTILTALAPLALARLDVEPQRRLRMQHVLAIGLLRMSAGRQAGMALTGNHAATVAEVEAALADQAGERLATCCRLAVEMAGGGPAQIALYGALGHEIGMARQIISDCHELVSNPECRDLLHGTRMLPTVAHINRLVGGDRTRFLNLLERARSDRQAEIAARRELYVSGAISGSLLRARLHYGRARVIIDRTGAREPGRTRLLQVVGADPADAATVRTMH
jgi:polyprenyl synthetase